MAWTDPTLGNTIKIKNVHVAELRSGVEALEAACATHNTTERTHNGTVLTTKYSTNNTSNNSTVNSHYSTVGCSGRMYFTCSAMKNSGA